MKYKHILIICLMICIIFSISSVNANDMNDTDMQQNESIIEISNEKDVVLSSNTGTFSDLYNEIQKGNRNILLTKNYTYTTEDIDFIDGISLDKPITIDGNGFTINGNEKSRAFNIQNNVILKNIHFENCYAKNGGAIIIQTYLHAIACRYFS